MKCDCCGEIVAFVGIQEYPAKYNIAPKTLIECVTYGCPAYKRTTTPEGLAETCEKARADVERKGKSA